MRDDDRKLRTINSAQYLKQFYAAFILIHNTHRVKVLKLRIFIVVKTMWVHLSSCQNVFITKLVIVSI